MKNFRTCFLLVLLWCFLGGITAQVNFNEELLKNDPVTEDSLSFDEKTIIYETYLAEVIAQKDSLKTLFGYIHLSYNYVNHQEYEEAMTCILEAEKLAEYSRNPIWKGQVSHCKGMLYFYLEDYDDTIINFKLALEQSGKGLDSQNVAITLEQLGAVYSLLEDYEKSNKYYEEAIPLVKKFCKEISLGITLANYGNLMSYQGRSIEAIEAYKEANEINRAIGDEYREAICMHNIADEYLQLGEAAEALRRFKVCIQENEGKPIRLSLLKSNYKAISKTYEQLGDYEQSIAFLKKYYELYEAQIGSEVQTEVADIQAKYVQQEQELALQKTETEESLEVFIQAYKE